MSVLEINELSIRYGDTAVVSGLSLAVDRNESVGLVGESGCGKTQTALATLGLLSPKARISGSIRIDDAEVVGAGDRALRALRAFRVGIVFQDPMQALNPSMRLGQQLAEVLTCHRDISDKKAWERCIHMLKRVNMPDPEDVMNRYTHQISGGQQQRAAIARALATDPALLIADEPTGNLDAKTAGQVFDLFVHLIEEQGKTMLMVTHDQELANQIPRKVEIVNGVIAHDSRPQAIATPAASKEGIVIEPPSNGNSRGIFGGRLVPNRLPA